MKAIEQVEGRLCWNDAEDLKPGVGEILIANRATAINRADLLQRKGAYPPPPGASQVLGLECAGEVIAVGEGVARFKAGDAVCALLSGGGYAEQVCVPAGQALPVPKGLSFEQAAAIPEVFATAYLNLFSEAAIQRTETVLLHAGASGVGTAAIQLCKSFDNPCFVTVGSDDKVERCIELGARGGCNRHNENFVEKIAEWTESKGIDVILDPVGGRYLADNIASLALEGRLVLIGLMGGIKAELSLAILLTKRLKVVGSTLRTRTIAAKSKIMSNLEQYVWQKFESGEIQPVIERIMPIQDADAAHKLVESDMTFGKVILTL
ncbi:MAG: NAD(P)H-quinone oxidoreductase [Pseudomonadales bacterium]|nr:NAD(P)H-quinone oxidoreductase [Pseudomonadales bacterium]